MTSRDGLLKLMIVIGTVCLTFGVRRACAEEPNESLAKEIISATGIKGGLIVHVGCGDGRLTAALRINDSYIVHGLDAQPANVEKAREYIQSLGIYGKVSSDVLRGGSLPYIDNMVNLVVSENLGAVSMQEVLRVLCPSGVAYIKRDGKWTKTVKPRQKEIDEWTHYLHDASNNAVAHDSVVGPPRRLQWVGSPKWSRHHDNMASMSALVSSGGRIFYIFDEGSTATLMTPSKWALIARDAFNGTLLWKRRIDYWHPRFWPLKSGPAQLPRRLVADRDTVYATLGLDAPVTALDAATGKTIRTYKETKGTEELILSDGVLFLLVNEAVERRTYPSVADIRRQARQPWWNEKERRVMAVRADTGDVLWQKHYSVMPITLAADSKRVFFHDGEKVVCLNRTTGDELWRSDKVSRMSRIMSFFAPTLVIYKDVVLFSGGSSNFYRDGGGNNTMVALSAETGKRLWTADHPPSGYKSPEDILVAGGLVWFGATINGGQNGVFTGRNPLTGEVKSEFPPDVKTYWFHHRCYRGKATDRYLLMSRTGIEFIDPKTKHWDINHWVRGGCLYGVMPCNGLVYAPPHDCICYPESKLFGFNALAPKRQKSEDRTRKQGTTDEYRLEKGSAYNQIENRKSKPLLERSEGTDDWPTYRHDESRSGCTPTPLPSDLKRAWETKLGGRLSSIVIADGKLFIASIDTHTLYTMDANSGAVAWSYTTGGRIDSPPTIYHGLALFGSADGYVYCLRASDGKLVWRFRAAPQDRRLMAFEQIESVWPVSGSVLVHDGTVYCVAGRSMFLDGGMRLLKLDPATGRKLMETILDDRDPETGENLQTHVKWLNMPVALPDVLSSDGRYIYMRSQRFDTEGKRYRLAPSSANRIELGSDQQGEGIHLFCPTGFLDGSWFHRAYWMYGRTFAGGWNGYFVSGKFAPGGRIMVVGEKNVYGFGRKPKYYRWTTPLEYHLFSASKEPPHVSEDMRKPGRSCIAVPKSKSLKPAKTPLTVEAWVKAEKGGGVVVARGGPYEGYSLFLKRGRPVFAIRGGKKLSEVAAKTNVVGKWTHLAGVLTAGKQIEVFVNGKLAASAKAHSLIQGDPAQAMEIGADEGGAVGSYQSPFGLTGTIDEVMIYHRALTADEIAKHYSNPGQKPVQDDALVLYYSFERGGASDESGKKNNGILHRTKSVKGKIGKGMRFFGARGGESFMVKHYWTQELPFFVRAMVLALSAQGDPDTHGKILFIAGPPGLLDEEDAARHLSDPEIQAKLAEQDAALKGKKGAMLWAVSASDGEKLAEYKLESPPVWDGMAAANGRLYLATMDGKVISLAARQ